MFGARKLTGHTLARDRSITSSKSRLNIRSGPGNGTGGAINIGGLNATAGIGTFTTSASSVNVTGTITNTGKRHRESLPHALADDCRHGSGLGERGGQW